jgi:hypothetical protein
MYELRKESPYCAVYRICYKRNFDLKFKIYGEIFKVET